MGLIFGRDGVCPSCAGRGWTASDGIRTRPAYPAELRDFARGDSRHGKPKLSPCRTCGCTGLVRYQFA